MIENHDFTDDDIIDAQPVHNNPENKIDAVDLELEFKQGAETITLSAHDIAMLAATVNLTIDDIAKAKIDLVRLAKEND